MLAPTSFFPFLEALLRWSPPMRNSWSVTAPAAAGGSLSEGPLGPGSKICKGWVLVGSSEKGLWDQEGRG